MKMIMKYICGMENLHNYVCRSLEREEERVAARGSNESEKIRLIARQGNRTIHR